MSKPKHTSGEHVLVYISTTGEWVDGLAIGIQPFLWTYRYIVQYTVTKEGKDYARAERVTPRHIVAIERKKPHETAADTGGVTPKRDASSSPLPYYESLKDDGTD